MAQPPSPDARLAVPTARLDRIEKGSTVYDAVQHPIGTIADVDRDRGRLLIDGRSVGFEDFDVPLATVRDAGDNEVHLTLTLDTSRRADGGRPQFTAAADDGSHPSSTSQPTTAATSPRQFAAAEPVGPAPTWANEARASKFRRWLPYAVLLAVGGLGAAAYFWWHRRRRKPAWRRAVNFLGDHHPAWWAGAAAVAPLAYSAWPSAPARRESRLDTGRWAATLPFGRQGRWTDAVSEHLPAGGSTRGLPLALLAAIGMALYAATRGKREGAKPRVDLS